MNKVPKNQPPNRGGAGARRLSIDAFLLYVARRRVHRRPRMMKPRIVVVGSSNTDMIVQAERIPRPGETILGGRFITAAGGKGANQAVAAARAGGAVTFVARVGSDTLGNEAIGRFQQDGINVEHVSRDPKAPSGVALIMVSRRGENSICVAPGANGRLAPAHVSRAARAIGEAHMVVLQLEIPLATVQAAIRQAGTANVPVILNPAPARPLPDTLLRRIAVLTPNETEAEILTGIKVRDSRTAKLAAERLLKRGVQSVVLTLGEKGAFIAAGTVRKLVKARKVRALDTTAAGDVFNGALAVAMAEGQPLESAVRFACTAATISVTRMGAQPSAPTRPEILRLQGG